MRKTLDEILESKVIGNVTSLTCNLGYVLDHVPRMQEPELAGGALLDLGVYTINFAKMVFGDDITQISSLCTKTKTGLDEQNSITMIFEGGKVAMLHSTMMGMTDRQGVIHGDKGYIIVENINNCEGIKVYNLEREEIANYETPEQITGFEYQVEASIKAIQNGMVECEEMPHCEIIRVMEIMDQLRAEWGIRFPFELA